MSVDGINNNENTSDSQKTLSFIQTNLKKSFLAGVELNKRLSNYGQYAVLLTEPYRYNNKFCLKPTGSNVFMPGGSSSRAAIITDRRTELIKIERLSNADCAVAIIKIEGKKIVLASVYLDINKEVVQPWLPRILEFVNKKKYGLIIGMDSNSHSHLYGSESNKRGEVLEQFISEKFLMVENVGKVPTFQTLRGLRRINTCIDVTLSLGVVGMIRNWHVDQEYNASDHNTILFETGQPLSLIHI